MFRHTPHSGSVVGRDNGCTFKDEFQYNEFLPCDFIIFNLEQLHLFMLIRSWHDRCISHWHLRVSLHLTSLCDLANIILTYWCTTTKCICCYPNEITLQKMYHWYFHHIEWHNRFSKLVPNIQEEPGIQSGKIPTSSMLSEFE